jgi:uncharacterized membrane protein
MTKNNLLLSESEQKAVVAAIHEAELRTSGEIRVHVEHHCPESDVLERAKQVFERLEMNKTELKNGVLFYLAMTDRKFAIIGDSGIDQKVPIDFWNSTRDVLKTYFAKNKFSEGLCSGVKLAGEQLQSFFPRQADDIDELPNDVSFG